MPGLTGAACPSADGSNKRLIWPNAEEWRPARTPCASLRCRPGRSTPRSSFSAERWCRTVSSPYRDDSPDEGQPITFADDRWRDYVPIAPPWTLCVRDRLPPGSVAVLINQAHTFTDLILTVDLFEDRLLRAIDGSRTLSEILRFASPDGDGESRALRFFERLWRYDQVVFDASRAAAGRLTPEESLINSESVVPVSLTPTTATVLLAIGVASIVSMIFQVGPYN